MNEEIELYLADAEESMQKAVHHLDEALVHIRAGKANVKLVDAVYVDYYGAQTPLSQVSNITTPDAKTIAIQPWEKSLIGAIEKAIINSNLGLNPSNNGEIIRIMLPPLTEDRRRQLVKQAKQEGEEAKISIRNVRRDTNDHLKKLIKEGVPEDMVKDAEGEVQKITDKYSKKIEELVELKEKEILTV